VEVYYVYYVIFSKSDRIFISPAIRFHGRLGNISDNNAKTENFLSLSLFRGGGDMNAATMVAHRIGRPQKRLIIGQTAGRRVKLFTSIAHNRCIKIIIFPPRNYYYHSSSVDQVTQVYAAEKRCYKKNTRIIYDIILLSLSYMPGAPGEI